MRQQWAASPSARFGDPFPKPEVIAIKKVSETGASPVTRAVVRHPRRGSGQLGAEQRRGLCSVPAIVRPARIGGRLAADGRSGGGCVSGLEPEASGRVDVFRYCEYCQSFVSLFPDLLVVDINLFHIQEWVDSQSGGKHDDRP